VVERASDKLQTTQPLAELPKAHRALAYLVVDPAHRPLDTLLRDAHLETADVQGVPDPLEDRSAMKFMPRQRGADNAEDEEVEEAGMDQDEMEVDEKAADEGRAAEAPTTDQKEASNKVPSGLVLRLLLRTC